MLPNRQAAIGQMSVSLSFEGANYALGHSALSKFSAASRLREFEFIRSLITFNRLAATTTLRKWSYVVGTKKRVFPHPNPKVSKVFMKISLNLNTNMSLQQNVSS